MLRLPNQKLIFSLLLISLFVSSTYSWGFAGHKSIASVAEQILDPDVAAAVKELLRHFTPSQATTLADIATWPDDYAHSPQGTWSAPNHYLDLDRDDPGVNYKYCSSFCVIKAIQNYTNIIAYKKGSASDQAIALSFLVHFIGDIHQPLHVSYEDDRGGNSVIVNFFGKKQNLHSVWDTYIIGKQIGDQGNWPNLATEIRNMLKKDLNTTLSYGDEANVEAWATESYAITRDIVYNYPGLPGVTLEMTEDIYYIYNLALIKRRLWAASARLAAVLTEAIKGRSLNKFHIPNFFLSLLLV